ncbi:hypothetical protein AM493_09910 [Flavobacterium akiainvivens]|uniref:Uncharacterized protein n=1 Tax=Flavobacterium akiainvivens TaxID=1202724 RepID=A0A0M8M9G5_9FLAO|nr:DUF3857 domain-containing protein [Flavobacterium akiainvivens]KOS06313.1 hypothetical protein AM493_09910 [Flavobacterium akiainvivens]SFQ16535.1 protein of unknown function [Flavobacterium akiainvivens]
MRLLVYIQLFLMAAYTPCAAQNFTPAEVTAAQLAETFYPADSMAEAVVHHAIGTTRLRLRKLDWLLVTTVTTRIKIYRTPGYEYADREIPFFDYEGYGCTISNAATYNLENGAIVKTVLQDADVYVDKVSNYHGIKKIHMPNVKEGSIIEYTYELISPNVSYIPKWFFQKEIPVEYSEYEVSLPRYFTFNRLMTGNIDIEVAEPRQEEDGFTATNVLNYKARHIPVIKQEPMAGDIVNYISAIWFEMAAVDYNLGESVKKFSTDWESMTKRLYADEDFGEQLKERPYKKELKAVIKDDMTTAQKADAIFNFAQAHMAWNRRESYYTSKGVKWAYENKTGNVAEINLMLVSMFNYAGIEAYPVLLSTRDNGVAVHPNFSAYNYVIASAKIDGQEILFDAANKHVRPGQLPLQVLNYKGRLLRPDGRTKEVSLVPQQKSKKNIAVSAAIDAQGVVSGTARHHLNEYYSLLIRQLYKPEQDTLFVGVREKASAGLTIANHLFKDLHVNSSPLAEEYAFVHTGVADVAGDKMYISPMLFFDRAANPFTEEKRLYPVDYIFPHQHKYVISITIPAGYVVESLPQSLRLELPDQIGAFNYGISASGNLLQFAMVLDINMSYIDTSYYNSLKIFLQRWPISKTKG